MSVLRQDEKAPLCFTHLFIYTAGEVGDRLDGRPLRRKKGLLVVRSPGPAMHCDVDAGYIPQSCSTPNQSPYCFINH
jgi:hypothetical protein